MGKVKEFARMVDPMKTLTPKQASAWTAAIAARAEAVRVLQLEVTRAEAKIAVCKADVAEKVDAILGMIRVLGLDETKNWRLSGCDVVEATAEDLRP